MNKWLSLLSASAITVGLAGGALAQDVAYETEFRAADDPSGFDFTPGDLDGQDDWTVEEGLANIVTGPFTPVAGTQYVNQQENSIIGRDVDGEDANRVIVRGWYRGQGSEELQPPPDDRPIAALLGFRRVSSGHFAIAAFDGNEDDYVEPTAGNDQPIIFANNRWHKIILSINYDTKTYDVSVNTMPHLQDVAFRDDTVEKLNGFQSFSRTGSNLDQIGFFPSDGDYDGDGISDDDEMRTPRGNPLDPDMPDGYDFRAMGDFNQDNVTNFQDFIFLLEHWAKYPWADQSAMGFPDFIALLENWGQVRD